VRVGVRTQELMGWVCRSVCSAEGLKVVEHTADANETSRLDFAMLVARDLYNYMGSFAKTIAGTEGILVPTNILNRWMTRFKTKYEKDATFLKKKSPA